MRIVAVGEGMLELRRAGDGWQLGYGGDTLNTAIHLARFGHDVAYLTALGSDPLSTELKRDWAAEGLDTSLILTDHHRNAGLYAISIDDTGERSFSYWRENSAARYMFGGADIDTALAAAECADLLIFSLISLAILPIGGRVALINLAQRVRANGGKVAFDGNYRPRLWDNAAEARATRDAAIACADIGLPTFEDEQLLCYGISPDSIAAHWQALGCWQTIVKLGPDGCRLPDGQVIPPPAVVQPVDTSGAGDAFNAGYINARFAGHSEKEAALAGHHLAGWAIGHIGAIPIKTADAPYK